MSEEEQPRIDGGKIDQASFDSLGKEDRMSTISWYLVTLGLVAIFLSAVCLWMARTGSTGFFSHRDFSLNPNVLGRYLLFTGIVSYVSGRALAYYMRFRKR